MKRARRFLNRRHSIKWGALTGVMGGATYLLQYIPDSWPKWLGLALTVAALAAAGISPFIKPESDDGADA